MMPSSEREMPTVTVLAWCLIASIGRVSSSIAPVSAATRSSMSADGVPTLPVARAKDSIGFDDSRSRSRLMRRTAVLASRWPS